MAAPLDSIGLSFAPTGQRDAQNGPDASPLQQAIKILSLRVPQNAGAGGIAPTALLTGPGAAGLGGLGGGMDLLAFLRRLLQPGAPRQPGGMGGVPGMGSAPGVPPPSVPLPNITPGDTGPRLPGPGTPTFPGMPAGAPTYDRRNPGVGNRSGGPILNDLPSPQAPQNGVRRGPWFRQG